MSDREKALREALGNLASIPAVRDAAKAADGHMQYYHAMMKQGTEAQPERAAPAPFAMPGEDFEAFFKRSLGVDPAQPSGKKSEASE
jgi:hypothetical protein